jgi:integrase
MKANEIPKLRLHRASGRAVVTLSGRDHYCGAWDSPEAQEAYNRLVGEWLAGGRTPARTTKGMTVGELARAFRERAEARYRKRGQPTSHAVKVGIVLADWVGAYGSVPLAEFGPAGLKAMRELWRQRGVSVRTANQYAETLRGAVRWAVGEERAEPGVLVRLEAVASLSEGRDGPRREPVRPVSEEVVTATVERLRARYGDLVRLQWHTGMRPGEACAVRGEDLDRATEPWVYRVNAEVNKSEHAGRGRVVLLGPQAREVVGGRLATLPEGYLFEWAPGTDVPGMVKLYWQAIGRACRRAGVPRWHPHQLRHSFATRARAAMGLEAARAALGHATAAMTEIYAERDMEAVRGLVERLG